MTAVLAALRSFPGVTAWYTAGRYDIVGGPRGARELQALIPYARLQILRLSGHFGHVEEPERFAEGVLDLVTAGEMLAAG